MEPRLIALKSVLVAMDISDDISTVNDRKRVQKAVYLAQKAGVRLGYSYGWYVYGPYSSGLTRDYYALADLVDEEEVEEPKLRIELANKIETLKPLLTPDDKFGSASQSDWLELLASWLYLRSVYRSDLERATATMEEQKPQLAKYLELADTKLKQFGLLS